MISSARRRADGQQALICRRPVPGNNVGRAISPATWGLRHGRVCGTMQASSPRDARQGAAKLYGVSRREPAMHPSVCCRRQLPLQGSLPSGGHPQSLPCKGRCRRRRRRGARLALPVSFRPAQTSGGRKRPPYNVRQAGSITGYDKPPHAPAQGPMISSARRRADGQQAFICPPTVPGHNVGRAISPAAWGLRHGRVCGTMQASSPYGCKARCCQTLRGIPAANRQCTPQSAVADSSPCRGASQRQSPAKQAKQIQPGTRRFRLYCFVPRPRSGGPYSKSLRQTADGTSPPMGGNLAPRRRTLPAQIVLEGRCVKFNHLRAVKKQWITGGCACADNQTAGSASRDERDDDQHGDRHIVAGLRDGVGGCCNRSSSGSSTPGAVGLGLGDVRMLVLAGHRVWCCHH